ncbi:MAG: ATP-binding protein, partial [Pseudomonadota bacterium]
MILRKFLGDILTDMGFVTRAQLCEALRHQKNVLKEHLLPERLHRVSLVSRSRLDQDTGAAPMLGQILTDMGWITEDQLTNALTEQKRAIEIYESLESSKLGALIEIGSLINSTLNLAEVLSLIMRHVNRFINSIASTLMLIDEETGELVFSVPAGPNADDLTGIRLPPGTGIAGWVAEHEEPVLIPNAQEDSRFYPKIDEISGLETTSVLCVPLKAKTKLIGVLEAINKGDGTAFTKEDEIFLSLFASQAAMAIENARLYSELKDQLAQSEQMHNLIIKAEKFEALGEMASGVAHDFNNILVAIMGYSELALQVVRKDSLERRYIDQVLQASLRAKELVSQILAFSRQTKPGKSPVIVHQIVKEALKLLRASLPSTIKITQKIATRPGRDTIMADPTQIHQILMNLCTNAHHAMAGKRGVIKVTLAPVDLAPQGMDTYLDLNPGPYLKMSVKDSGYGMDPETLKRIFDPYFTTKEKGVGTGMGLAVVHGIVKNHGGAITVESAPGEGTTFNIFFPRIEQDVKREVKALEPLPVGTERILFVDDEDTIVELSKEMLERLGYSVV